MQRFFSQNHVCIVVLLMLAVTSQISFTRRITRKKTTSSSRIQNVSTKRLFPQYAIQEPPTKNYGVSSQISFTQRITREKSTSSLRMHKSLKNRPPDTSQEKTAKNDNSPNSSPVPYDSDTAVRGYIDLNAYEPVSENTTSTFTTRATQAGTSSSLQKLSEKTTHSKCTKQQKSTTRNWYIFKRLPEVSDSFVKIRQSEKIFIDKSQHLEYFLNRDQIFYFLVRPRRFGKSLFAQMIASFFKGEKQYFKNLTISKRGNGPNLGEWVEHPIIYLDFSSSMKFRTAEEFEALYHRDLERIANNYSIKCTKPIRISEMIEDLKKKCKDHPAVIVIDEYDAPIRRALYKLKNPQLAEAVLACVSDFLTEIKSSHQNLKLVYITGVMKLAHLGITSGANSFEDISYADEFAGAIGFSESDISQFKPFFSDLLGNDEENYKPVMNALISWYDGYSFSKTMSPKIFNPISIIQCLRRGEIKNYWTETGGMEDIIDRFKESRIPWNHYENFRTDDETIFASLDIIKDVISLPVAMFSYGYLTIKQYSIEHNVILTYPNKEIKSVLHKKLYNRRDPDDEINSKKLNPALEKDLELFHAFQRGSIEEVVKIINENFYFAKAMDGGKNEDKLTSMLILFLQYYHVTCKGTVKMKKGTEGDIDLQTTAFKPDYVIEIKRAENGIEEIMEKFIRYSKMESFFDAFDHKENVTLLGLNFDHNILMPYRIVDWVRVPYVYSPNISNRLCTEQLESSIPGLKDDLEKKNIL